MEGEFTKKMRPLVTPNRILKWFYLYDVEETTYWERVAYMIFNYYTIISNAAAFISGFCFFLKFVSFDLEEALFSVFPAIGYFCLTYTFIAVFCHKRKVASIIQQLTDFYDARKKNRMWIG